MKILQVHGHDYAAMEFWQEHAGTTVNAILESISSFESSDWKLTVIEIPEESISKEFLGFIRNEIQNYDDAKANSFWMEDEIIQEDKT